MSGVEPREKCRSVVAVFYKSKLKSLLLVVSLTAAYCGAQQPASSSTPQSTSQNNPARNYPLGIAPDSTPLFSDLKQAWGLSQAHKLDDAGEKYRQALDKAIATHDLPAQVLAHGGLAWVLVGKGDYKAAQPEDEQALAILESLQNQVGAAQIYSHLGSIAYAVGNREAAQGYYRQALAGYDSQGMLRDKSATLRALEMSGAPEGDKLLDESLAIARQLGDKALEANVLQSVGDNLYNHGQLDAAEDNYSRAISLLRETGDKASLAYVLTSQGRLLRAHGVPEKAIPLYQEARDIQEKNGDHSGAIQSTNAMAVAYGAMGNNDTSIRLYEEALAMARTAHNERYISFELGNLASSYERAGRDKEAVTIMEELLRKGDANAEYRWQTLGLAYLHLHRPQDALEALTKSIDISRQKNNWDNLASSFLVRSACLEELKRQAEALSDAQEALRVIEDVRAHVVQSDFMKRGFSEVNQSAYSRYVHLLERAQQPGRALEIAEEARARAFLDLLGTRDLQAKVPEEKLAGSKTPPQLQARVEPSPGKRDAADSIVMRGEASKQVEASPVLAAELSSNVAVQPFSLQEMQATARRLNSTILSYWVTEDFTYIWVVSPVGEIHTAEVNASLKNLQELISGIAPGVKASEQKPEQAELSPPDSGKIRKNYPAQVSARGGTILSLGPSSQRKWRELYKLLIEPVEAWLPAKPASTLTIEPYGPLLMLPFAALTDKQGRYLLERYSLHYTPAISLLRFTERKEEEVRRMPAHYLLVADPAGMPRGPDQSALPALPGSRKEVAAVARLLPAQDVTVLEGSRAGEGQVSRLAAQNTVIHFATHGIIRDDQPFDSYLALGAKSGDAKEDGRLTAEKIYGMNLHADLVFLSACRSGQGKVSGDGLIGLTRAFWYAGTPSVISSLWDVADEPTYRLVESFYQSRLQGNDKSHALRSAQLHLLHQLRAGRVKLNTPGGEVTLPENPMFWAGFVLQGEP